MGLPDLLFWNTGCKGLNNSLIMESKDSLLLTPLDIILKYFNPVHILTTCFLIF